jgi:hypothetical protein
LKSGQVTPDNIKKIVEDTVKAILPEELKKSIVPANSGDKKDPPADNRSASDKLADVLREIDAESKKQ